MRSQAERDLERAEVVARYQDVDDLAQRQLLIANELDQRRMQRMNDGEEGHRWLTDEQVDDLLRPTLQANPAVDYMHMTGRIGQMRALDQEGAILLQEKMLLDPKPKVIIIPQNNGGHWTVSILRCPDVGDDWFSYHVQTDSERGRCGVSLSEQVTQLVAAAQLPDAQWQAEVMRRLVRQPADRYIAGRMEAVLPTVGFECGPVDVLLPEDMARMSRVELPAILKVDPSLPAMPQVGDIDDDQCAIAASLGLSEDREEDDMQRAIGASLRSHVTEHRPDSPAPEAGAQLPRSPRGSCSRLFQSAQSHGVVDGAEYDELGFSRRETAIAIGSSLAEMGGVDRALSAMSEAEISGDDAVLLHHQSGLIDIINDMSAEDASAVRDRLASIKINPMEVKPSIQFVIDQTVPRADNRP